MTTITIRDLRQRWPAAERALQEDNEIIVTRDGEPIAKLIRYVAAPKRARFDSKKHLKKMLEIQGGKILPSIDPEFERSRDDRKFD